jgi:hypothetical protein
MGGEIWVNVFWFQFHDFVWIAWRKSIVLLMFINQKLRHYFVLLVDVHVINQGRNLVYYFLLFFHLAGQRDALALLAETRGRFVWIGALALLIL